MFGSIKRAITSFVLGICLLGGAVPLHAQNWRYDCPEMIRRAEFRYHRAVRMHGPGSPQAERRRVELERVRERCRAYRHRRHRYYRDHRY
jgi:hypothetical protein